MAITLTFGAPVGFDSHGVLLPCIDGATEFHGLRAAILGSTAIRQHAAHITLAHPRNPRAPGNSTPSEISLATPLRITFNTISLIEQVDGGPWVVREVAALGHPERSDGAAGAKSKDPWVCGGKRSFDCAHFVGFAQDDTPGSGALHLPPLM